MERQRFPSRTTIIQALIVILKIPETCLRKKFKMLLTAEYIEQGKMQSVKQEFNLTE